LLPLPIDPSTANKKKTTTMQITILASLTTLAWTAQAFVPRAFPMRQARPLAAVSKKDTYEVTLLPGDGIGPEITAATKGVLATLCKRCDFSINLKEALIGGAALDAVNDPFPDESLAQCQASDSVLLACIGGYKWDNNPRELRPESGLLKMRKSMQLFANLRPAKVLPQLIDSSTLKKEVVEGVDIMVVRELTGDVYFGTPKGIDVIDGRSCSFVNVTRVARVCCACVPVLSEPCGPSWRRRGSNLNDPPFSHLPPTSSAIQANAWDTTI
jgi:hypothetical protein